MEKQCQANTSPNTGTVNNHCEAQQGAKVVNKDSKSINLHWTPYREVL